MRRDAAVEKLLASLEVRAGDRDRSAVRAGRRRLCRGQHAIMTTIMRITIIRHDPVMPTDVDPITAESIEAMTSAQGRSRTRFHAAIAESPAAVAAPAISRAALGQTPQVTLKLHHFLPPVVERRISNCWRPGRRRSRRIPATASGSICFPRCSSAARRRSSTTRRATASPTSSGPCRARRRDVSRASKCSSFPSSPTSARVTNAQAVQDFYEAQSARRIQGSAADLPLGA